MIAGGSFDCYGECYICGYSGTMLLWLVGGSSGPGSPPGIVDASECLVILVGGGGPPNVGENEASSPPPVVLVAGDGLHWVVLRQ